MKVGLVSDTHDFLDPKLEKLFAGCALVLHAGDVTREAVVAGLSQVAPVRAARGNNDVGPFGASLPEMLWADLGQLTALVVHDVGARAKPAPWVVRALARRPAEIVVHGHSHRHGASLLGGRLFLNPGSAGPRRFRLPRTAALLEVHGRSVDVRFVDLAVDPPAAVGDPFRARL